MRNFTGNAAFTIDSKIGIKLDYEFAVRLGNFILESKTIDKQIMALGHNLCNLEEDDSDYEEKKEVIRKTNKIYKNISSWQDSKDEFSM